MNWKEIGLWSGLALLAGFLVGLGGFLFIFLLPLPLAFLVNRTNLASGVVMVLGLVLLLAAGYGVGWLGGLDVLFGGGQLILLGLGLGCLLKRSYGRGLGGFLLLETGFNLIFFGVFFWSGANWANWQQEITAYMEQSLQFYASHNLWQGTISEQTIQEMVQLLLNLAPSMVVIYSLILGTIAWLLAYKGLKSWKLNRSEALPFIQWRLPWPAIWGVILGLGTYLGGQQWEQNFCLILGENLLYIFGFLFGITGLALLIYCFKKWRSGVLLKLFLLIFLVVNLLSGTLFLLLPILGIFDSLANWRAKFTKAE